MSKRSFCIFLNNSISLFRLEDDAKRPIHELSSSISPMALISALDLERRDPSAIPVVPSSPVFVVTLVILLVKNLPQIICNF
jgi:hypothetical protein